METEYRGSSPFQRRHPRAGGQVSLVGGQAFLAAESHLIRNGWRDADLWGHWLDKACTPVSFLFTAGYPYTSQKAGPYRQRDSGGNWLRGMQQVRIGADLFCWLDIPLP